MKPMKASLTLVSPSFLALGWLTGCESTGGSDASASASTYYGVGVYDSWYYHGADYPPDVIVAPPPRPDLPPRPMQPIARPLPSPGPRPMPSIPSAPRPMPMRAR